MSFTLEERRVRRAARREEQRRQNVLRAAKMHTARLAAPPVKRQRTFKVDGPQKYHVGCSGWYYWHWRDIFYPQDLPSAKWFDHYVARFRTVELNAPFYSWPTVATVKTWLRQIGKRQFLYTVKVNELITHTKRFDEAGELVQDFGLIADMLGRAMGCFLFQLPPSVHYAPALLAAILSQLDHRRRNVVEFRHKSWWNEDVYGAFRETGTIFCSCSGPRLPDELVKTADDIYVRFHGTKQWYRHDYSKEELAVWADRVHRSGARHCWVYFNNDRDGHAIRNASEMLRQLKLWPGDTDERPPAPLCSPADEVIRHV
jgi:uncharacterized protein YecE (DUF72 family)